MNLPPSIDIRTVGDDEFVGWVDQLHRAFFVRASASALAEWRRPGVDLARTWGAFDGPHVVGTFRTFPTRLTVPGGAAVPADAVTNVTVAATHRRRGILTGLMRQGLAAAAGRGDVVSLLIASEYPIYGRFGYGPATEHATVTVDAVGPGSGRRDPARCPTSSPPLPARQRTTSSVPSGPGNRVRSPATTG